MLIIVCEDEKLVKRKEELIANYKRNGYLESEEIIRAFRTVPREKFIGSNPKRFAYLDRPLSIASNQTISAPHMVAMMVSKKCINLNIGDICIEVGAGSGYHAAVIADIIAPTGSAKSKWGHVYTIERIKNLVDFAKVYGITDPKYVGSEEQGIVACHAFANHFTIKALYKLLIGMKLEQDGEMRPFVKNPGKLLHAGNEYDWEGCVDVKPGDKLKITAKWGDVWMIEENMILFAKLHCEVKNQEGQMVCKPIVTAAVRPGGY